MSRPQEPPRFLTPAEVSELFRQSKRWAWWAASQGPLKGAARRIGRKLLFDRVAVEQAIEKGG